MLRLLVWGAVVLIAWLLYAPSLQLMLLHDDTGILVGLESRTVLSIFESRAGDALYRPLSYLPWLLIRDAFGWYQHALIHFWNVAGHTLNTALVVALAARAGRMARLPGLAFPALAGLVFALYPFSYQSVLWASAIVHPLMLLFSLGAVHAYLTAARSDRPGPWLALSAALILAACLSHEMGFIAGALVLFTEGLRVLSHRDRLRWSAIALFAFSLAYPLLYRAFLRSQWVATSDAALGAGLAALPSNMVIFLQGMAWWAVLLLRDQIGLTPERFSIVTALFFAAVLAALFALWRMRILLLGLYGLAWWLASAALLSFFLPAGYLYTGPRLLYASSVGVALFWAALIAGALEVLSRAAQRSQVRWAARGAAALLVAATLAMLAWGVPFIRERIDETARLTPAMKMIDADLRRSDAGDAVLVINQPTWNSPFYPAFPLGTEGMPIFAQYGFPWEWIYGVSGARRDTAYARYEPSLKKEGRFDYDVAGTAMDDDAIRRAIFGANLVYRFDYDAPGPHAQRLAALAPRMLPANDYVARYSNGPEQAIVRAARATQCGDRLQVDLTWSDVRGLEAPMGVFVHGYDAASKQIFSADRDLVDGHVGLQHVPPGLEIAESRVIPLDSAAPVGEMRIGVYFAGTGQRLRAWRADGTE